ncbi:MAG: hypothetical protein ABIO39_01195 [Caulobacteraceae bacterium]
MRTDERAWRDLATAAMDANRSGSALLQLVKATAGKTIPTPAHRDQAAFVALQALARASALRDAARRRRLSGCLKGVATECARAAEWTREAPERPAPQDLPADRPATAEPAKSWDDAKRGEPGRAGRCC